MSSKQLEVTSADLPQENFGNVAEQVSQAYGSQVSEHQRLTANNSQASIQDKSMRLKNLRQTQYDPDADADKLFFVYLQRLANAQAVFEKDRMDGRKALNEFIIKTSSLMHQKGVNKAKMRENMKQDFNVDKLPVDESGNDAIDNLYKGLEEFIATKQTMQPIAAKQIRENLLDSFIKQAQLSGEHLVGPDVPGVDMRNMPIIREKNLIQKTSGVKSSVGQEESVQRTARISETQDTNRSLNEVSPSFKKLQDSIGQENGMERTSQGLQNNLANQTILGSACTGPQDFSQGEISPSHPRFMPPEDPIKFSSSMVKIQPKPDLKLSQFVQKDKKRMNEKDRFNFELDKTLQVSKRSHLIEPEKPNIFSRVPKIFGSQSENDQNDNSQNDQETAGYQTAHQLSQQPFTQLQLDATRQMLAQGGTSGYLMLKFQVENVQMKELSKYNQSIVKHNKQELSRCQNEIQQQVLKDISVFRPRKSSLPPLPHAETTLNNPELEQDQRLEHTIGLASMSGDLYSPNDRSLAFIPFTKKPQPFQSPVRPWQKVPESASVMSRIGSLIMQSQTKIDNNQASLNSFGLTHNLTPTYKPNVPVHKPRMPIPVEASVVVFIEDGSDLREAPCFRYNLAEIIDKYKTTAPNPGAITQQEYNLQNERFQNHAYDELMEQCSDIIGKRFNTCFTIEGKQLKNMQEVLTFMEDTMLKDFMSGKESPTKRQQQLSKLNKESKMSNSPSSKLNEFKNSQLSDYKTTSMDDQTGSPMNRMLNDRSGSNLSYPSIQGIPQRPQILLLSNRNYFRGLIDGEQDKSGKQLRVENANETRKFLGNLSKKMANKVYLEWANRMSGKIDRHNMKNAQKDFAANKYVSGNNEHWEKVQSKLQVAPFNKQIVKTSRNNKATFRSVQHIKTEHSPRSKNMIAPPFQGGGLTNANTFMLPQVKNLNMNSGNLDLNPGSGLQIGLTPTPNLTVNTQRAQSTTKAQIEQFSDYMRNLQSGSPDLALATQESHPQQKSILYGQNSNNWDPKTFRTLDVLLNEDRQNIAQKETELAKYKLKLPPSKRKIVPFNQRSELNQQKAQSKPDPNEVAKIYVQNLQPRQKKLIAETINARTVKKKKEFEEMMRQERKGTMLRADSQLTSVEDFREMIESKQKASGKVEHIDFEKVRELSKEFNMDGKDVYDIYTKYNGMHELARIDLMRATGSDDGIFQVPKSKGSEDEGKQEEDQEAVNGKKVYDYSKGIPLKIFMENCNVFKGKHQGVIDAILKSLNIQQDTGKPTVNIEEFLQMSSIMTHFTATQDARLDFWIKIFNPTGQKKFMKDDFQKMLEMFVIGNYSKSEGNIVSELFCKGFYEMICDKGIADEATGEIDAEKFKTSFMDGSTDIKYLNQLLKSNCNYVLEGNYGKY